MEQKPKKEPKKPLSSDPSQIELSKPPSEIPEKVAEEPLTKSQEIRKTEGGPLSAAHPKVSKTLSVGYTKIKPVRAAHPTPFGIRTSQRVSEKKLPEIIRKPLAGVEVRGPVPNFSKLETFENGLRLIMNEDTARNVENAWTEDTPFGCRVVKSDANGLYRAIGYAYLERVLAKGEESLKDFINLIQDKLVQHEKTEWIPGYVKENLQRFVSILQGLSKRYLLPKNASREILRGFLGLSLYSAENFDHSVIFMVKFLAADLIMAKPNFMINDRPLSEQVEGQYLDEYVTETILGENVEAPEIIYHVIPAALGISLVLYEYSPAEEEVVKRVYTFLSKEEAAKASEEISLLISPRGIFGVLYPKGLDLILKKYDEGMDAGIVIDPDQIIQPVCCCNKYYKKSYYQAMIKQEKCVTKKCIVCGGVMDNKTYNALEEMTEEWNKGNVLLLIISLIAMVVSTGFVLMSLNINIR